MTYGEGVRDGLARAHVYVFSAPSSCLGPHPSGQGAASLVLPGALAKVKPVGSWLLAVILCPGESVAEVTAWARKNRVPSDRVWFFLHPLTPIEALRPWVEAGFQTDQVEEAAGWRHVEVALTQAIHDRAYADRITASR